MHVSNDMWVCLAHLIFASVSEAAWWNCSLLWLYLSQFYRDRKKKEKCWIKLFSISFEPFKDVSGMLYKRLRVVKKVSSFKYISCTLWLTVAEKSIFNSLTFNSCKNPVQVLPYCFYMEFGWFSSLIESMNFDMASDTRGVLSNICYQSL